VLFFAEFLVFLRGEKCLPRTASGFYKLADVKCPPLIGLTDIITEWVEERFPGVVGVDNTGINMPPDFEEP